MLRGSIRRWALVVGALAAGSMAVAASAWGCASVTSLDFTPAVARPGDQVEVLVTFTNKDKPVEIRWASVNGPLLATIEPTAFTEGLHGNWRFAKGTFTVPADAPAGSHIVVASQEAVAGTATWGMPARGLLHVSAAGTPVVGAQPGARATDRPLELVSEDSVGTGELVLVGMGAAGVTLLLGGAGLVLVTASARRDRRTAAVASTGTQR